MSQPRHVMCTPIWALRVRAAWSQATTAEFAVPGPVVPAGASVNTESATRVIDIATTVFRATDRVRRTPTQGTAQVGAPTPDTQSQEASK
jgi:hypothetical protein